MFYSTKRYGHEAGLSAVFRQWKAKSHCNQLHGYALAVTLTFGCRSLDSRDWVVDFGALKPVKFWLEENFDHKVLIATDDPAMDEFNHLHNLELIQINRVPSVGCEAFAEMIGNHVVMWLDSYLDSLVLIGISPPIGLQLFSVEVAEHAGNSAIYHPTQNWKG